MTMFFNKEKKRKKRKKKKKKRKREKEKETKWDHSNFSIHIISFPWFKYAEYILVGQKKKNIYKKIYIYIKRNFIDNNK